MNFEDIFIKHLKEQGIKIVEEQDGDNLIVDIFERSEVEPDHLRACTFCFNKDGFLTEVWHGEYKGKYEDLNEGDNSEKIENEQIGKSLKLIAVGINNLLKKKV